MKDNEKIFIKGNIEIIESILKNEREIIKEKIASCVNQDTRNEMWFVLDYISAKLNDLSIIKKPPANKSNISDI